MPLIFLYRLFYPLLLAIIKTVGLFHPKIRKGIALRRPIEGIKPWLNHPQGSRPLWFHCASGEYEYAKPVIRLLKQQNPQVKILVTYFSPSVEPALKKATDIDFFCPTPWDKAREWQDFIDHHQPQALLVARTDLWPMMIATVKKNGIPSLLFSKTVNQSKSPWQNCMAMKLMKKMNDIFCATEIDRTKLSQQLKPYTHVHSAGDTRYDQCLFRIQHPRPLKPLNNFYKALFIAGSTWPKDEEWLAGLIASEISETGFIVAPHEPTPAHLKNLIALLDRRGVRHCLYSETNNWHPESVLIVDEVGILADLYAWGRYAFIGGSVDRSVHSVMEPLAQGLVSFVGPKYLNNREAITFKEIVISGVKAVQVAQTPQELSHLFAKVRNQWSDERKLQLQLEVRKKSGASQLVKRWLDNQLKRPTKG